MKKYVPEPFRIKMVKSLYKYTRTSTKNSAIHYFVCLPFQNRL